MFRLKRYLVQWIRRRLLNVVYLKWNVRKGKKDLQTIYNIFLTLNCKSIYWIISIAIESASLKWYKSYMLAILLLIFIVDTLRPSQQIEVISGRFPLLRLNPAPLVLK